MRDRITRTLLLAVLGATLGACADDTAGALAAPSGFLFVLETDDSLRSTGAADYRSLYATATTAAADAGAAGVALKFFFLEAAPGDVDANLAAALGRTRGFLQYALVGPDGTGNPRPAVLRTIAGDIDAPRALVARAPDFPIVELAAAAAGVGFVDAAADFSPDRIPMLGRWDDRWTPALVTTLLDARFDDAARLDADALRIAGSALTLDDAGRATCDVSPLPKDRIRPIEDLVAGRVDTADLAGKIVVIGYDGADAPTFRTGMFRERSAHLLFMDRLACLEARIAADTDRAP